jgi:hypothetical protein
MEQLTLTKISKEKETIYKMSEEVIQKMEEYYRLKADYEIKEKKYREKLKPPKCIFCKRPGGTIFKIQVIEGDRILLAYCNVKPDPCKTRIDIHTGKINLYMDKMREYENKIKELKQKVILYKNDLLFGYIPSTKIVDRFNSIKRDIDQYTLDYYFIKENYELYVDNIQDYVNLCDLEKKSYLEIEDIRTELNRYKSSKEDETKNEIITSVVSIYKNKLIHLLNEILHLKYSDPEVICDNDDNSYKLIEIPKKYKTKYNEFSLIPIKVEDNISNAPTLKTKKDREKIIKKEKSKNTTLKFKKKIKPDQPEENLEEIDFIPTAEGSQIITEIKPIKQHTQQELDDIFGEDSDEEKEELTLQTQQEEQIKQLISRDYKEIQMANNISTIIEEQQLYDPNIVLFITSNAETNTLPAGKAKYDKVPIDKLSEFTKLNENKDWRRKLSNFATSKFILDSKTWKTVEQYFQASKFKKNHPEIYEKFSLDYNGEGILPEKPDFIISTDISLAKHYGTDGIYKDIKVRPDEITIDEDFQIPIDLTEDDDINRYRENYEMFLAQKAKFTQNEKMKQILLDTKNAKLIDSDKKILYIVMFIRHLLQTEEI